MAYSSLNLRAIFHATDGSTPSIWEYRSTDDADTVTAVGYFKSVGSTGLKIGDIVIVADSDNSDLTTQHKVTSIIAGNATVSRDGSLGIAEATADARYVAKTDVDSGAGIPLALSIPAIFRRDMVSLNDLPLVFPASGAGEDTRGDTNSALIQALIDEVSARPQGGVISLDILPAGYSNNTIALGQPLVIKPKVDLVSTKRQRFRATRTMDHMLTIDPASEATGLLKQQIRGGYWDGASKAKAWFNFRNALYCWLSDFQVENVIDYGILLGYDNGLILADAGARICDGFITRSAGASTIGPNNEGSVGVWCPNGHNDGRMDNVTIVGFEQGVDGIFYTCKFTRNHPWADATAGNIQDRAFRLRSPSRANEIFHNQFGEIDVEGVLDEGSSNSICYNNANMPADQPAADRTVYLVNGVSATNCTVVGNHGDDAFPTKRFAGAFNGDPTLQATIRHNSFTSAGAPQIEYEHGYDVRVDQNTAYSVTFQDEVGNTSATTVSADWFRHGPDVTVVMGFVSGIARPVGVDTADEIRVMLPFPAISGIFMQPSHSGIELGGGWAHDTSERHTLQVQTGENYATIHRRPVGSLGATKLNWGNMTDGAGIIHSLTIRYRANVT